MKVKAGCGKLKIMEITYLGHSSFKIKGKTTTLVTDPYDEKMIGLKFPKTEADIITVSHAHSDHNKVESVSQPETGNQKIINGPGEYEVKGISVIGIKTYHDEKKGEDRGKNTIYIMEMEDIRLLHLGDLGHTLGEETLKEIGSIDVLFLPVGGTYTIDAKTALAVAKQIGPSIIIPMHYQPGEVQNEILNKLTPVEDFLQEFGGRVEKLPKLIIKEGDILSDEEYAAVLEKK